MRKLAWWLIGVGLLSIASRGMDFFLPHMGEFMETGYEIPEWRQVLPFLRMLGVAVFSLGALLLPATVIADAITKAQGTREGP